MSASAANQQPTPIRIFQMLNAFQQTEALRAAIDLDVFTQLSDGALRSADLAKRIQAALFRSRCRSSESRQLEHHPRAAIQFPHAEG